MIFTEGEEVLILGNICDIYIFFLNLCSENVILYHYGGGGDGAILNKLVNMDKPPKERPTLLFTSVADPHHFYAAPAPGKNFDAAPAPTLPYRKTKFLKRTKV
jgi:hypothetical protein